MPAQTSVASTSSSASEIHRIVRHGASPVDPALGDYRAWRRHKVPLPIDKTTQELTDAQDGRRLNCGGLLFAVEDRPQNPRECEHWLAADSLSPTHRVLALLDPICGRGARLGCDLAGEYRWHR
jgi:hypothetical protein